MEMALLTKGLLLLTLIKVCFASNNNETRDVGVRPQTAKCRERGIVADVDSYEKRSCAMCYLYLFRKGKDLIPDREGKMSLVKKNGTLFGVRAKVADVDNPETAAWVCSTLTHDECHRWKECCGAARECCARQLSSPVSTRPRGEICPRTWDGYACWDDTEPSTEVTTLCPSFMMQFSLARGRAQKLCTAQGWSLHAGYEWTNYTRCLDKDAYMVGVYITLVCNIISLCLLLPAVLIFLLFRDLYKQQRVRLHINFFVSMSLACVAGILWYMVVHRDLLMNPESASIIFYKNPIWCRVLSFFKIYLTSTKYFWMFCEGYYLHRLITNAFEPPKTMTWLYLLGWGAPALFTSIYGICRAVMANDSCWGLSHGGYEWIYYTPHLLCLLINLVFLCNILRILMFKLHSHPHEPSNFRRGLKAAFMLIPLFGLQLFLTIYRPSPGATGERQFEYITFFITSSQGLFVSLVFCFFNTEVHVQLKMAFKRLRHPRRPARQGSQTLASQASVIDTRWAVNSQKSTSNICKSLKFQKLRSPETADEMLELNGRGENSVVKADRGPTCSSKLLV